MKLNSSYLTSKTSQQEVEQRIDFAKANADFREDWERLLGKLKLGDELWNFEPPSQDVYEVWGVALVRSGKVVSTLIEAVG